MRNWLEVNCLKNESKTFWYVPLMVDNYILYFRWFSECLFHSLVSAPYNLWMRLQYWRTCLLSSINYSVDNTGTIERVNPLSFTKFVWEIRGALRKEENMHDTFQLSSTILNFFNHYYEKIILLFKFPFSFSFFL